MHKEIAPTFYLNYMHINGQEIYLGWIYAWIYYRLHSRFQFISDSEENISKHLSNKIQLEMNV